MNVKQWTAAIIVAASLSLLVACGKKEPAPEPVVEETPAEEAVSEESTATTDEPEEAEETQEIVEESASEAEPEDEAIVLAQAEPVQAPQDWQFKEGTHYDRLVPTQPTVGGADKIEVAEFFWYGCPHCEDFEPFINQWDTQKPVNVRLVKIPIVWNQLAALHGQMFYTAEILARNGVIDDKNALHQALFQEYHRRGNRMTSLPAVQKIFERFGVTAEQFKSTWESFEVNQQLRIANDLMRRYKIDGVPAVVVNGKYRTGATKTGSYPKLLELIDELIVREGLR